MEIVISTKMLNAEKVMEHLGISRIQLQVFRELGILKPIYLGNGWKYSQKEIFEFQDDYAGLDVSNPQKAKEAKEKVDENKKKRNYQNDIIRSYCE